MRFNHRWQFWIARGGTFTGLAGRDPDGNLHTLKLLSENPEQYRDAAAEGVRHLLGLHTGQPFTPALVECVKMGTTFATTRCSAAPGSPPCSHTHQPPCRRPAAGLLWIWILQRIRRVFDESFPENVRGTGVGLPYNTGRMLSAAAPTIVGFVSAQYGFMMALTLIAATFVVAAVAGIFLLPKTKKSTPS